MACAAIAARAGRQRADEVDLGEEFDEIARPDRARLHEVAMLVAGEAGAHEDVQDVMDVRLGLAEGDLSRAASARVRFEWQQWW